MIFKTGSGLGLDSNLTPSLFSGFRYYYALFISSYNNLKSFLLIRFRKHGNYKIIIFETKNCHMGCKNHDFELY